MNTTQYKAAIDAFNKTMADCTDGWANDEARAAVLRRIADIKVAAGDSTSDGYFSGIIHKLERQVDELYSARKHLKYRDGSRSGVEELRSRIHSSIYRLEGFPGMTARLKSLPD